MDDTRNPTDSGILPSDDEFMITAILERLMLYIRKTL